MGTFLWALQLIVSLIGVLGCFGTAGHFAFKEDWRLGVICVLLPVAFLYYIPTRWRNCKYLASLLAVCGVIAALLQRARLGYWAWPDVGV